MKEKVKFKFNLKKTILISLIVILAVTSIIIFMNMNAIDPKEFYSEIKRAENGSAIGSTSPVAPDPEDETEERIYIHML